jgi:predicted lipid-binding transport protein (Tim44 family)
LPALEPESESDVDIYTIIFLALAVFIFLRLRSVLGQRTGSERPPYDRAAPNVVQRTQDNNNVVPMPGAVIDQPMTPRSIRGTFSPAPAAPTR